MLHEANNGDLLKNPVIEIEKFQAGDRQTFKTVFDSLYSGLCLFTNRYTNNLPSAEDIAQECFVVLWNHRDTMMSVQHIKSFLYLTARNNALDYLRHEKIRNNYQEATIQELETSENFIHFVIEEEVEQILLKTEENLPHQCRQIFVLAMQGMDNEEIASRLNISVNTVKTQKKIAYRKLKRYISELGLLLLYIR